MKTIKIICLFALAIITTNCGDDGPEISIQSDQCNDGDQATLSLNINGVGSFIYSESGSAESFASDTEGSGIDAIVFFMVWIDPVTGDSLRFDITVENETLATTTYNYNAGSFNGTVNFYIYQAGAETAHYLFTDWTTTIDEFEEYTTSSQGGFTTTRLAFVRASTSGTLTLVGSGGSFAFTSSYTICPKY